MKDCESLDWADADKPIVDTLLDQFPSDIVDTVDFDYMETEKVTREKREMNRRAEDYEKSQRAKKRAGDQGEAAVLRYEKDKLNNKNEYVSILLLLLGLR